MVDSLIHDPLSIKSRIRDYSVNFTDDYIKHLNTLPLDRCLFMVDEKVAKLYAADLDPFLSKYPTVLLPATEEHKTMEYSLEVVKKLVELKVKRNHTLIAIGGGIIQDITAFIASILYRGVDWIFFPTTLLAQCDSCIGSKSSINVGSYKNLVGTFCPPSLIVIDNRFLETLPISDIKSGIGEMMHYFLSDSYTWAQKVGDEYELLLTDRARLVDFMHESLRIKKATIEIDEFDKEIRHIFNYGHTFGHAIEAITHYAIPHGQAITVGMDVANYISWKLGRLSESEFYYMNGLLKKNKPAFQFTDDNLDEYMTALSKDKKNVSADLSCILTSGPKTLKKVQVPLDGLLRQMFIDYSLQFP
jgi:3-dehydroquinate synthase